MHLQQFNKQYVISEVYFRQNIVLFLYSGNESI